MSSSSNQRPKFVLGSGQRPVRDYSNEYLRARDERRRQARLKVEAINDAKRLERELDWLEDDDEEA